jgi:hypothetical protein
VKCAAIAESLSRYFRARRRWNGRFEVTVVLFDLPSTERDLVKRLEQMARDYLEPAMKL